MSSSVFYLTYVPLWILVILHSVILLGLLHIIYRQQRTGANVSSSVDSNDGHLKPGQEAPRFSAKTLSGTPISSSDFAGPLTALLFVSPHCQSCATTLAEMEALSQKVQGNVIVICRAGSQDCDRLAKTYALNVPTLVDEDERLSRLFGISSVPMAVLINEHNRIHSYGSPMRTEELEEMFEKTPVAEVQEVR